MTNLPFSGNNAATAPGHTMDRTENADAALPKAKHENGGGASFDLTVMARLCLTYRMTKQSDNLIDASLRSRMPDTFADVVQAAVEGKSELARSGLEWMSYRCPEVLFDDQLLSLFVDIETFVMGYGRKNAAQLMKMIGIAGIATKGQLKNG